MPSVGSEQFISVVAEAADPAEMVEEITRPHVDGVALKRTGKRGVPFRVVAVRDVDTQANLEDSLAAYSAMQGTIVTVVNNQGISRQNVAVLRVPPAQIEDMGTAVGGIEGTGWSYMVTQNFECIDTNT